LIYYPYWFRVIFPKTRERQMRNRGIVLITALLLLILSCKSEKIFPDLTADQVNAETAWNRIMNESNYRTYNMWPSHEGVQPGQSPHGRFHRIFINSKLHDALPIPEKVAPTGSIIVKENYSPDKELGAYTIMIKVAGYNPDNGDWFFAKYKADGTEEVSGRIPKCADCHAGLNDWLMVHKLDQAL
jgi:hypothetical protein